MASDGLMQKAKNGKCRICHRTRSTEKHLKAVGEIRHGYATGHIWECLDIDDCDRVANDRIKNGHFESRTIEIALQQGRFTEYKCLA
jgi:hypothetical protein